MAKEKKEKKEKKEVKKVQEVKQKTKKVKKEKNKESFFKGLKKEVGLVKWPEGKEIVKYTVATIVFCFILIMFFQGLNLVLAYIKELFN